jgi:hypothetical protein
VVARERVGREGDPRVEQAVSHRAAQGFKLVGCHGVGCMEDARRESCKRDVLFFMCYMKLTS